MENVYLQSLSPGMVRTEMTMDFNLSSAGFDHLVPLTAFDIANACITVLATPPNVLV